jgi:pimeloyl-ACP methyl ester carboxylesterase
MTLPVENWRIIMLGSSRKAQKVFLAIGLVYVLSAVSIKAQTKIPAGQADNRVITEADCTAEKLGASIPVSAIGEPVSGVTLSAPVWTNAVKATPAYCSVNGSIAPVSKEANARPINFRVALPASWSRRAAQLGGGGMNGSIPNLLGGVDMGPGPSLVQMGFATYGSDSGHQMSFGFGRGMPGAPGGAPSAGAGDDWALNDEAIKNLGYMQLKKTHDAAMVLIERLYGEKARFNYYFGSSQGGREALTVAQRYPADYDGVAANVPIVSFSTLMLAPELIRIQEKPSANYVPLAKTKAISGEFMRQCDKLDGLVDGIINNYMACRAIFDRTQAPRNTNPWSAKRCPNNIDPNPGDTSGNACLTDGQIDTLKFVYSRYPFATLLANGVKSFGMWTPNTDPSGSGLMVPSRYRGQEGAGDNAPMHSHMGALGVTGFLMKDTKANPLDYVEGGALDARRRELSQWLDSTNPDLKAFYKRGGKLIVAIGTNDTLASPGAQLDYYQSVVQKMGRKKVNAFARLYVLPQTGHGLSGTNYSVDGDGKSIPTTPIPSKFDRLSSLVNWVEKNTPPPAAATVTAGERSLPMCSYPTYPKYIGGPTDKAESYKCTAGK